MSAYLVKFTPQRNYRAFENQHWSDVESSVPSTPGRFDRLREWKKD